LWLIWTSLAVLPPLRAKSWFLELYDISTLPSSIIFIPLFILLPFLLMLFPVPAWVTIFCSRFVLRK
jgi:hypothetical protein